MSIFISNILNKLSEKFWVIVAISAGCFMTPIGFGVASLLVRSSSLSYQSGDTKINLGQVKQAANHAEYSNRELRKKIEILQQEIATLKVVAKNYPDYLPNHVGSVEKAFSELKPTATEAIENNEELKELVEDAISTEE